MSSSENSPPPVDRRASYAPGSKLTELLGRSPSIGKGGGGSSSNGNNNTSNGANPQFPSPIATAAVNAQRRRMSISTLGLSGNSPTQSSPFGTAFDPRRSSVSSMSDESAVEEVGDASAANIPTSPFARRMSFGARAMRDIKGLGNNGRTPSGGGGGSRAVLANAATFSASPSSPLSSSYPKAELPVRHDAAFSSYPPASAAAATAAPASARSPPANAFPRRAGEGGFNWSDHTRSRAERSGSIASTASVNHTAAISSSPSSHHRANTLSTMGSTAPIQTKEPVRERRVPDAFQERILKGDFYMD